MVILIAVGGINALYFALLICFKRRRILADSILTLLLTVIAATFGLVYAALEFDLHGLLLPLEFANLLYAPLFHLYVASLADPDQRLPRGWPAHFSGWIASTVYLTFMVTTRSPAELDVRFSGPPADPLHAIFWVLDVIATPVYLALAWRQLERHRRQISERYSDWSRIDYRWLRLLLVAIAISWVVIDLPIVGSRFLAQFGEPDALLLGFSAGTLLVLYLGAHGFRQPAVYGLPEPEPKPSTESRSRPRYRHSGLTPEQIDALKVKLVDLMESRMPHLNSELTIRGLAQALGLTEHNASEVINVGLKTTFYDLVNRYRVESFQGAVLAPENAHRTLLAVAMDCGFSSKSSFNRIFKQHTGITPSAFVKSQRTSGGAVSSR